MGFGKGRFLLERARANPEVNFLGIERLRGRVLRVGKRAERAGTDNIRVLRIEGNYAVKYLIPHGSIRTCYIFFPDPWPKKKHHFHRIMHPGLIDNLLNIMEPDGVIHFATDHLPYFYDAVRMLEADERIIPVAPFEPADEERTDFELMFIGKKPIGRYSFTQREET